MIVNNAIELCQVAFGYFFLFSLVPFWVRGFKLTGENVLDNLVSSFIIGHIIIINCVFLLSLMHIYYQFTLILLFILIIAAYRFGFKREVTIAGIRNFENHFINLKDGYYHPKQFARYILGRIGYFLKSIFLRKVHHPFSNLVLLAAIAYGAYYRGYHSIINMGLGTSDMYLHLEWIKYLDINVPFKGGIYPFGLHCVVSAIGKTFNMDPFTVMRMLGAISGFMIVFGLYYILSRTFKSRLAVNVGMIFYCVTNLYSQGAILRQMLALPQEYGMIFLYFSGYFMHKYMKEKDFIALVCFVGSVAMTLISHFYITIFAVVLCAAVFIGNLVYLKKDVFFRLVIAVVCALLIALAPFFASYAQGTKLQNSLFWALSVMQPDDKEEKPNTDTPPKTEQEKAPEAETEKSFEELLADLKEKLTKIGLTAPWHFVFIACIGTGFILLLIKCKGHDRQWDAFSYSLYCLFILGLSLLNIYKLVSVVDTSRLVIFLVYSVPLVLAIPIEIIYNIFHSFNKIVIGIYTVLAAMMTCGVGYYVVDGQYFREPGASYRMQYNGAVIAYYNITKQYEDKTWTIVSTTDEYSVCLNKGWHAEQSEFMVSMHHYDEKEEIIIPTKYVFIYVDKRPQPYVPWIKFTSPPEPFDKINPEDVTAPFDEIIEETKRNVLYMYKKIEPTRILQAKTYAWAQEYMKYFPNEMDIFYEDDEIVVYKIEQNPYALNNFLIPYEGTSPEIIQEPIEEEVT